MLPKLTFLANDTKPKKNAPHFLIYIKLYREHQIVKYLIE